MNNRNRILNTFTIFFVSTTCISIATALFGTLFFPNDRFGYGGFFLPSLFGFFSALIGFILYSEKELSPWQLICRRLLYLVLIELMVLTGNSLGNKALDPYLITVISATVLSIFIAVSIVMWLIDHINAKKINAQLIKFQKKAEANDKDL